MMRSILGGRLGIVGVDRMGRDRKSKQRRLQAGVEGLESRNLMSVVGPVTLSAGLVTITPAPNGPNTAVVSYQNHSGATMLDVNLNGTDNYFSLAQVGMVEYMGSGISGDQEFQNNTNLHTVAFGGTGTNLFEGGSGQDVFVGGSGSNTFDAGSGFDVLIGGSGTNAYNESSTGFGIIIEVGSSNTISPPSVSTGNYIVN